MHSQLIKKNQDSVNPFSGLSAFALVFGGAVVGGAGVTFGKELATPSAKRISHATNSLLYDDPYGHEAMKKGMASAVGSCLEDFSETLKCALTPKEESELPEKMEEVSDDTI